MICSLEPTKVSHRHYFNEGEVKPLFPAPCDKIVVLIIIYSLQGDGIDLDFKTGLLRRLQAIQDPTELAETRNLREPLGVE